MLLIIELSRLGAFASGEKALLCHETSDVARLSDGALGPSPFEIGRRAPSAELTRRSSLSFGACILVVITYSLL